MLLFFFVLATILIAFAFITTNPIELFRGLVRINTGSSQLTSDFVAIGGFGATLLNVALILLFELGVIYFSRITITGTSLAVLLTTSGFAFFGTSLFNMLPIVAGVLIYALISKTPFHTLLLQAFMGTAIGPLINTIAYAIGLDLAISLPLAFLTGLLVGLVIPPLSKSFLSFHQGYNLYNVGFTAGVIGLVVVSIMRLYGVEVNPVNILDTQHRLQLIILCLVVFLSMMLFGLILNKWNIGGYRGLLDCDGRLFSDFVLMYGSGLALVNMGLLGLLSLAYVLVIRGPVNGPIVGAMMTIAGFGALGKHPRNCLTPVIGSTIACYFHKDLQSSAAIVPILFSTTLAPVAGKYGPVAGLVAGYLHIAVVGNVLPLHGGLNLYNNGFSGGFVAAAIVSLVEAAKSIFVKRKTQSQSQNTDN